MEVLILKIEEAARVLGIGRTTAYAAVKSGDIPTVRIGGRRFIPKPALMRMLEQANRADGEAA